MPDSDLTLSTLPEVADYQNSRWLPSKPEMEITIERNEFGPIATATPTFVTVPDSSVTLPTLSDVH